MFEIEQWGEHYFIVDAVKNSLHSDGSVYDTLEYFPTKETAQKILDKYYPKPKHEWKHGDVFKFTACTDYGTMMYVHPRYDKVASVVYVDRDNKPHSDIEHYLKNAKFLFNIKEKICPHQ